MLADGRGFSLTGPPKIWLVTMGTRKHPNAGTHQFNHMTIEEIKIKCDIAREMERRCWPLKGQGNERKSNRCPLVEHKPTHQPMSVYANSNTWYCHDCDKGGDVIDFVQAAEGISTKEAILRLGGDPFPNKAEAPRQPSRPPEKGQIVKRYTYTDEKGAFAYEVCRYEPKTFRQRHKGANGEWVWSMEGVRRVLYNLPAVLASDFVYVVEGEKDADTINAMKFCATCNVGGADKWDASYSASLRGKEVILCGDNDEPGQKHVAKVQAAIASIAKTVRVLKVPQDFKDVTEWMESFPSPHDGATALLDASEQCEVLIAGHRLPLKSVAELEQDYIRHTKQVHSVALFLDRWLPSTAATIRPIVPGEVVTVMAGTGVGKTHILENIALNTSLPTLMFEMELPETLSFERLVAKATGMSQYDVEWSYKSGEGLPWRDAGKLGHVYVCSESKASVADIQRMVTMAALKTGVRPRLVLIDYIQLIDGKGDRYNRISDAMEQIKIMAKATNTVVVLASQIGRQKGDDHGGEVFLSDAKESGCLSMDGNRLLTPDGFQYNLQSKMDTVTLKTNGFGFHRSSPIDSGTKDCIRLSLKSGRFVECTPDHRILTDVGWIAADEVTREHAIACCRQIPEPKGVERVKEARMMGWMLGDGCMVGNLPPHFTSADPVLSAEFVAEVRKVTGLTPKPRKLAANATHIEFYVTTGPVRPKGGNPLTNWLRKADMWDRRSWEKRIPEWFLKTADNESIKEIVGGLIDTDGSVKRFSTGRINIAFASTSEGMCWDMIYCLTRLGIFARLQKVQNRNGLVRGKYKAKPMYGVLIDDGREIAKFRSLVRLTPRKQHRLDDGVLSRRGSNHGDHLGKWVWKRLAEQAA